MQVIGVRDLAKLIFPPFRLHHLSIPVLAWYCSSVTFSIHSTNFPLSPSWIAMWVIAVVGVAPCQCLCFGGHQITSPGRISTIGPPSHWVHPQPAATINVWPSG